ncbi:uncharacterized protein LOC111638594 isoform X1 [Centruroides sculpturatus]|uniref:uncharacterized protein LOC111638594 isoform X1 n=1 Tax=Centruroides sculpturatus TaxID=218467 RepID=UPI000C6D1B93|nr:uncharacterized protein LOC111638594 isoform X1 [Centruroides sculpturatus]
MEICMESYLDNICLVKQLDFFLSVCEIFGLNLIEPCKCRKSKISAPLFSTYERIIEIYAWVVVIFISTIFVVDIPCARIFNVFEEHAFYSKLLPLTSSLYVALQFSIVKRKKFNVHNSILKSRYEGEEKCLDKAQPYVLILFSYTVVILAFFAVLIPLIGYPYVNIGNKYKIRAITCLVTIEIWFMVTFIHIASMFTISTLTALVVSKRLSKISSELQIVNNATKYYLQNLIEKFMELWEIFQQVNEKWELLLPLIYIHFVYETCFIWYGVLFAKTNLIVRLFMAIIALQLLSLSLLVCWGLSTLTSIIYDNFISVEKYFSAPLTLTYKLKIVCFMKIFGGLPIGISIGGFFFVKKNFLIRAANGFHSVFSTLIEVTGVLDKNRCTSKLYAATHSNDTII